MVESFALTMSTLSFNRKSVDSPTVQKIENWNTLIKHTLKDLKVKKIIFHENLESEERINKKNLFQIWCLYISYRESYQLRCCFWMFMTTCTISNM